VFFFQAEDGIRDFHVTGVQTCALPISKYEPTKSEGAKFPPLPPAPSVNPVATDLNSNVNTTNANTTHWLSLNFSMSEFSNIPAPLLLAKALMLSYPSPKSVGNKKINTANIAAPTNAFL